MRLKKFQNRKEVCK